MVFFGRGGGSFKKKQLFFSSSPLLCFYNVYQDMPEILLYELTSLTQMREIEMTFLNEFKGNPSRQSHLAHLATVTVGRHRRGEESVPKVSSTCITVSHRHHCNCAVMSLSLSSLHPVCVVVCGMLHIYVLFSLSLLLPTFTSSSLCVG